ncbi:PLP-dependent aminotransferase family protein [Actinoplanes sp. KI2]|uniref:MocR-like pyridoxine biosynthesis transcription factor PdxR n=1 Tax=Actinoplanes sp. KI2 TaxID=2983315 RepID=UPI0021D59D3D|nr:PLP-dependent aminotransferase family protein [Actinoplanes sp. KI2]MCU7723361.1 PLP-dependent aminotransferase family protein [Actinoplanes sp. KI2]
MVQLKGQCGVAKGGPISGSDFLQLRAEDAPVKGLTAWLTAGLRDAIAGRRLAAGARLPATRVLAADLKISRGVVVEAYQRLIDEGLATGRTGAGTIVIGNRDKSDIAEDRRKTLDDLRLPFPPPEGIDIDLSPGVPDLSAFPRRQWLKAEKAVLDEITGADLGYGDPGGTPKLRAELIAWLRRTRGIRAEADDIVVVNGVAQALALLARTLRQGGVTAAAIEDPGSRGTRDLMIHWGVRPEPVPVDEQGIRADLITQDAAVLTPAHQFPTGVVLSPARRRALLDWGGLIVEDDYDAEHRYDRAPVAALQGSAPERVAYTGSVSKSLAPGMRLGWLIAPRRLQPALLAAKHDSDLGSPALPQLVLARLLASGDYERHLRLVRSRQRRRRDALLTGLAQHLPRARVTGVAAGLHLLILLEADGPDDTVLAERAAAHGVLVHPLSWHRQRPGPPGLVLGYAAQPPDRLAEAAQRLGRALTPP